MYTGWTIYLHKRWIRSCEKTLLLEKLAKGLPGWCGIEESGNGLDLEHPKYGYDVKIQFGNFVSPLGQTYGTKITSYLLAFKKYRNKEHRRVLFSLWYAVYDICGEAYLNFASHSKMIRKR
jgi:hypothetical protein